MKKIKNFFSDLGSTIKNIFIPDTIILTNSKEVIPPKPMSPYIIIALIISAFYFIEVTGFDLILVIRRFDQLVPIMGRIFNPDLGYASNVVDPIFDTIQMSFLGTFMGVIFAMPVAFFASSNINKNKFLVGATKVILVFFRTYPIVVYAMILVLLFRYGTFAGTIALTIFTFSIVSKMLYEHIETIDLGAFEAMQATGSSILKSFITAILPEILPAYYSIALYSFEINIRHAAVLGYVNAGGIGMVMNDTMSLNQWEKLGTILIALFIVVFIIEYISKTIRKRLV
mgnify:CR=1 FL=1